MTRYLSDKVEGYLSKEAKEALQTLVNMGVDKDLAIAYLERNCKDTEIYDLEEESEE